MSKFQIQKTLSFDIAFISFGFDSPSVHHFVRALKFGQQVPRRPRRVGGVKGRNQNEISFPRSPAPWARSFTLVLL